MPYRYRHRGSNFFLDRLRLNRGDLDFLLFNYRGRRGGGRQGRGKFFLLSQQGGHGAPDAALHFLDLRGAGEREREIRSDKQYEVLPTYSDYRL